MCCQGYTEYNTNVLIYSLYLVEIRFLQQFPTQPDKPETVFNTRFISLMLIKF